jgi:thiamine kinase-like enzyme
MNKNTKIDSFKIYRNDITDRAKMLFYLTNLRHCVGTRYLDSESNNESYAESNLKKSKDSEHGSGVYDLFIQSDPDQDSLIKAYETLKSGAYIYTEHSVSINSKTAQFTNTMNRTGFDNINMYLPKPDPSNSLPKIFIPLDVPGAIEFLIDISYRTTTSKILRKASHSFRKLLWRITPKLFLNYPGLLNSNFKNFTICTLARKPLNKLHDKKTVFTSDDKITIRIDLFEKLRERWENWGLGRRPDKVSTLILGRGKDTYTKLILLVFAGSDPDPALVIKIPLTLESAYTCSNEEKVLNILNSHEKTIERIPKLVFSEKILQNNIIYQSYLSGVPLNHIINTKNYCELAISTTHFLARIASETKCKITNDWKDIYIKQVLSDLDSSISSILKTDTIDRSYEILENFNLPVLVCEHRDLAPVNINLNKKGELGVIDWESARLRGLPGLDLIFFLTRICIDYNLEPGTLTIEERYLKMINPDSITGSMFNNCIKLYTSELGISHKAVRGLRILTWIIQAHIKFLDVTTGTLKLQNNLSTGTRFAIKLWEEEVLINLEYTD